MATEVTIKLRDNPFGQAFYIQHEEWDLTLSEVRGIIISQEIDTPVEFRFISGNGNILSTALESRVSFREVVGEPFAEIKKEDDSLDAAEKRVVPQITIVALDKTEHNCTEGTGTDTSCPFINKFPCLDGFRDTFPCMRNVFNIQTLLKMAFLLTSLLFLMVFVLALCVHMLFGVGALSGMGGHIFPGMGLSPVPHQTVMSPADQEALSALRVKLSELEVTSRFEIQDLKRKLGELEDLYIRDIESHKKDLDKMRVLLTDVQNKNTKLEKHYATVASMTPSVQQSKPDEMCQNTKPDNVPEFGAGDARIDEANMEPVIDDEEKAAKSVGKNDVDVEATEDVKGEEVVKANKKEKKNKEEKKSEINEEKKSKKKTEKEGGKGEKKDKGKGKKNKENEKKKDKKKK